MIALTDVKKGTPVKYEGKNRTYLKDYPSAELSGDYSSLSKSAMVEFYNDKGEKVDYAWVGIDYISPVQYSHQETIDTLNKKREALIKQAEGLQTAIDAL